MKFTKQDARFSDDRKFRFSLYREWDSAKPKVAFIGLNPSTANEITNDNTITKCAKIAANNGFGAFYMINLFTYVTAYPNELLTCGNPDYLADDYIHNVTVNCSATVACWGAFKQNKERANVVLSKLINPLCLKINADGSPKHPLYCKDDSIFIPFNLTPTTPNTNATKQSDKETK